MKDLWVLAWVPRLYPSIYISAFIIKTQASGPCRRVSMTKPHAFGMIVVHCRGQRHWTLSCLLDHHISPHSPSLIPAPDELWKSSTGGWRCSLLPIPLVIAHSPQFFPLLFTNLKHLIFVPLNYTLSDSTKHFISLNNSLHFPQLPTEAGLTT
jgi:hypothetical protein